MFRRLIPCLAGSAILGLILAMAAHAQDGKQRPTPAAPPAPPQVASQAGGKPDPAAIKDAETAQKAVQQKETELLKVLQEITDATKDLQPGDMLKEQMALDGFRKLLPLLKERSAWLLGKQEEFAKNMALYQAALEKTPAAFRRAGAEYARFAAEEEDLFFKEQYLDMANRSKKLVAAMEGRAKAVKDAQAEVAQKLKFVEKSVVFLNRLEEFLAIYDPANGKSAEVDAYLKQLDGYISHFHQSIGAFKQLSDRIQNTPASPSPSQAAAGRAASSR